MVAIIDQMTATHAADDALGYGWAVTAPHEMLFVNCGIPYVHDDYRLLSGKVALMRTNLSRRSADARQDSMDKHRRIARLLEQGAFEKLEPLLQRHVGRTVQVLRPAMQPGRFDRPKPLRIALMLRRVFG